MRRVMQLACVCGCSRWVARRSAWRRGCPPPFPATHSLPQAEKLVAKLDTLGSTAGDLGLSLFKVAKFEVRRVRVLAAGAARAAAAVPCGRRLQLIVCGRRCAAVPGGGGRRAGQLHRHAALQQRADCR
jgi:hypothetical protein